MNENVCKKIIHNTHTVIHKQQDEGNALTQHAEHCSLIIMHHHAPMEQITVAQHNNGLLSAQRMSYPMQLLILTTRSSDHCLATFMRFLDDSKKLRNLIKSNFFALPHSS